MFLWIVFTQYDPSPGHQAYSENLYILYVFSKKHPGKHPVRQNEKPIRNVPEISRNTRRTEIKSHFVLQKWRQIQLPLLGPVPFCRPLQKISTKADFIHHYML